MSSSPITVSTEGTRADPDVPRGGPRRRWVGLALVGVLGMITALLASTPYFTTGLAVMADDNVGLATTYVGAPAAARAALYVHIVGGTLALVLMPFQFSALLRRRARQLHRITGRVYLASVGVGAVAGLVLLPFNSVGLLGVFGFGGLAVVWLWSGARAYRAVRAGDLAGHQAWMIRNGALTFAAPTLRLWLLVLIAVQVPFAGADPDVEALFAAAYAPVPFLCWLPNLVVAEWLVRRRGLPSYRLTAGPVLAPGPAG